MQSGSNARGRAVPALATALAGFLCSACSSGDATSGGLPDGGKSDAAGAMDAVGHDAHARDSGAAEAQTEAEAGMIGDLTGTTAIPVDTFLDSVGACVHVAQGVDSPSDSATALSFAGIRNIRDDGNPATVPSWISMHDSAGVRLSLLTNQDVSSTVTMAEQLNAAGALLAVEGPNEPNNFPVTYEGQTSGYTTTFLPVAELQRDLYAAVKADPSLAGIPVFHSSEAGGSEPDDVGLQFLTIPSSADIAM